MVASRTKAIDRVNHTPDSQGKIRESEQPSSKNDMKFLSYHNNIFLCISKLVFHRNYKFTLLFFLYIYRNWEKMNEPAENKNTHDHGVLSLKKLIIPDL